MVLLLLSAEVDDDEAVPFRGVEGADAEPAVVVTALPVALVVMGIILASDDSTLKHNASSDGADGDSDADDDDDVVNGVSDSDAESVADRVTDNIVDSDASVVAVLNMCDLAAVAKVSSKGMSRHT